MRYLFLTIGMPGSGKSTFLDEAGLGTYTISPDAIRLQHSSPMLNEDGTLGINQKNDKHVWKEVYARLEKRMQNGDLTVLDAVHSSARDYKLYKQLATKYRYRVYGIDFRDVPAEECKRRNVARGGVKVVPDFVMDRFAQRFESFVPPSFVNTVKPDEISEILRNKPLDFNKYEKVVHVGDIHGCWTALEEFVEKCGGIQDDTAWVFIGDFVDRGTQNKEVVEYMISIMDKPNVYMVEGNHERHLWAYANDTQSKSREFNVHTDPQLKGIDKKQIRQLYRRLAQCCYYIFDGDEVLVTHGGLSALPESLAKVPAIQMIKGVGDYNVEIDRLFHENTGDRTNVYQVHGHRNNQGEPVKDYPNSFNLEQKVEFGGDLAGIVHVGNGIWEEVLVRNTVFKKVKDKANVVVGSDNERFLAKLRNNTYVNERVQQESNISSFNFSKNAFFDGNWDKQTVRARGLFVNTETAEIVIRSYNKFFNLNEPGIVESRMDWLKANLSFPAKAWVKENGYLGLAGYDTQSEEMVFASKSTTGGPYADNFRRIFDNTFGEADKEKIKKSMISNNSSWVFEVIDPVFDPHLIKYDSEKIVLLDAIKRSPDFVNVGATANLEAPICSKVLGYELHSWEEFEAFCKEASDTGYTYKGNYVEGFVIEDSVGHMVKLKTDYYAFWKRMRGLKERMLAGTGIRKDGHMMDRQETKDFLAWMQGLTMEDLEKDIITLRDRYEIR